MGRTGKITTDVTIEYAMSPEFDFIRWLRARSPRNTNVLVGPGDDCAVLSPARSRGLITTDILTEGTDFTRDRASPRDIGRKAMAVNLSDIAAMGGRATNAVVGLVIPHTGMSGDEVRELYLGLEEVAGEFGVPIVGGDTNSWNGALVISVTVLGEIGDCAPLLRSGAKVGDAIFVTGPCGGSILGRHLNPRPRLKEIAHLAAVASITSCIDISDGLSADLRHILDASGCGAILDVDAIPIHTDAIRLSEQTGKTPLHHALADGEDFELIFTVPAAEAAKLAGEAHALRIGTIVETGLWLRDSTGVSPLEAMGWVHTFAAAG